MPIGAEKRFFASSIFLTVSGIIYVALSVVLALTLSCPATAARQRNATVPLTSHLKYTKEVTIYHGLELVGWPFATVASFPTIPYDLGSLQILLGALQNDECYFRPMSPEKLAEIRRKYYEPLLNQTLQSVPEEKSGIDLEKPASVVPNRKAKQFHLNSPVGSGDPVAKRCRTD